MVKTKAPVAAKAPAAAKVAARRSCYYKLDANGQISFNGGELVEAKARKGDLLAGRRVADFEPDGRVIFFTPPKVVPTPKATVSEQLKKTKPEPEKAAPFKVLRVGSKTQPPKGKKAIKEPEVVLLSTRAATTTTIAPGCVEPKGSTATIVVVSGRGAPREAGFKPTAEEIAKVKELREQGMAYAAIEYTIWPHRGADRGLRAYLICKQLGMVKARR